MDSNEAFIPMPLTAHINNNTAYEIYPCHSSAEYMLVGHHYAFNLL